MMRYSVLAERQKFFIADKNCRYPGHIMLLRCMNYDMLHCLSDAFINFHFWRKVVLGHH